MKGRVLDSEGAPVVGALVGPKAARWTREGWDHRAPVPFPWEEGGGLVFGEGLTGVDGSFGLEVRHRQVELEVRTRTKRTVQKRLPLLQPGGELSGVVLRLTE